MNNHLDQVETVMFVEIISRGKKHQETVVKKNTLNITLFLVRDFLI